MEAEVTPEPDPDELRAIVEALGADAVEGESAWWRAGLPGDEPDDADSIPSY